MTTHSQLFYAVHFLVNMVLNESIHTGKRIRKPILSIWSNSFKVDYFHFARDIRAFRVYYQYILGKLNEPIATLLLLNYTI